MADNDDIVQNIDVNVNDDNVGDAFEKLKSAAQGAFDAIKDIFEKGDFGAGFEKFKESGAKAFEALKEGGKQAFDAIRGAGAGAADELRAVFSNLGISLTTVFVGLGAAAVAFATGVGLAAKAAFNFVEAQSKIVNALGDLSDKTHTAIADVSALETAYAHAGVSANEFASGYSRLSDVVEKTWDKIKKDTQNGVDTLEQRSIAAARAASALKKIEDDRKDIKIDRHDESKPVDSFKGDLATSEATERALQKELELRQARLAARQAEKAENDARRDDLNQVTKGVQELIGGNENALKTFNATAENIVKGVVAAAGHGSEALDKMGESFAAVGSKAPEVKDVLVVLGNALSKIEDPALRNKVALEALGKSGQSFLSALDSGKLDGFIVSVNKMGGAVNEVDKKIASDFKSAITGLGQDLDNISTKISSAFGPGVTALVKGFDEFLIRNQTTIIKLADAISSVLTPALKVMGGAFTAVGESISAVVDIIGRIGKLIESVAKADFKGIVSSAKELVETLKAIDDATSKNADQRQKGLDKLAELRKKDFDDDKKKTEDESRVKSDKSAQGIKTPSQDEWDKLSEDEKQTFLRNLRTEQDGVKKSATKPAATTPTTPEASSSDNRLVDKLGQGARQLPSDLSSVFESLADKIRNVLQTGSVDGKSKSETDSALQPLLDGINSLGTKLPEKQTGPASGLGIRGEVEDAATKTAGALEETISPLDQLKTAAAAAAEELNKVRGDSSSDSTVEVADGGHIRGPGTSTSDSIPAMLSDGEFVLRKEAVDRIGVSNLQDMNEGRSHYASGGPVRKKLPDGRIEEITYGVDGRVLSKTTYDDGGDKGPTPEEIKFHGTPNERAYGLSPEALAIRDRSLGISPEASAIRDRAYGVQPSGSDASSSSSGGKSGDPDHYTAEINNANQDVLDSINAASEAEGEADPNFIPIIYKNRKRHAEGGLIGDLARALNNFKMPRFAEGGSVSLAPRLPRFAEGGPVSLAPRLPRFASGGAISEIAGTGSGGYDMPHLGTIDLTTNHGSVRAYVDNGGLGQLQRASVMKSIGTGSKPSWVK